MKQAIREIYMKAVSLCFVYFVAACAGLVLFTLKTGITVSPDWIWR